MSDKRLAFLLAATLTAGCSAEMPPVPMGPGLAAGLRITEVALYQGVKSSLMRGGAAVDPPEVPLVSGRPGLLRVFVAPETGAWSARTVKARLALTRDGQALPPREQTARPLVISTDRDLGSTINFELSAEDLTGELSWSVSLWETTEGPARPGSTEAAAFPALSEPAQPLSPADTGTMEVVLIPVRYDADGSGRMPDLSAAQLERLRAQMYALYPVREVRLSVGEVLPWAKPVEARGSGWGELLDALLSKRMQDGAAAHVYYYGVFSPAASPADFCGRGCVAGLSLLAFDQDDAYSRGSIGLGYGGKGGLLDPPKTFVHEIGHAHGREHAPCDLYGEPEDPDYPYSDGRIGVWGYDLATKLLKDPSGRSRDMMGYCEPAWISDYTYRALFERITHVNHGAQVAAEPRSGTGFRSYTLDGEGEGARATLGRLTTVTHAPGGQPRRVNLVDRAGRPAGQAEGRFYPYDHLPGGVLLVPEREGLAVDLTRPIARR